MIAEFFGAEALDGAAVAGSRATTVISFGPEVSYASRAGYLRAGLCSAPFFIGGSADFDQ
jgi:hypothetical protein